MHCGLRISDCGLKAEEPWRGRLACRRRMGPAPGGCTNKANSPGGAGLSCTNKANLERPAARRGVAVNKQSQLPGRAGRDAVRLYKQTQSRWPGRCLQGNSATSPRCPASGNKAKPGRAGVSGGQDGGGRSTGQMRQTNPMCPAGPGAQAVRCCTNKANCRRTKKKGKCLAGKELW
jgi:hypothetical protein